MIASTSKAAALTDTSHYSPQRFGFSAQNSVSSRPGITDTS